MVPHIDRADTSPPVVYTPFMHSRAFRLALITPTTPPPWPKNLAPDSRTVSSAKGRAP